MRQEEVENITLKAIANELFISSSTVIRACKKLGYQTYNELRYDLRLSKELKKNQAKLEHNSFEQLKEQLHVVRTYLIHPLRARFPKLCR